MSRVVHMSLGDPTIIRQSYCGIPVGQRGEGDMSPLTNDWEEVDCVGCKKKLQDLLDVPPEPLERIASALERLADLEQMKALSEVINGLAYRDKDIDEPMVVLFAKVAARVGIPMDLSKTTIRELKERLRSS